MSAFYYIEEKLKTLHGTEHWVLDTALIDDCEVSAIKSFDSIFTQGNCGYGKREVRLCATEHDNNWIHTRIIATKEFA